MAYQPVYGNPPSGQTQYPANGTYPMSDNPPPYPTNLTTPYPTNPNPPYNPTYAPSQGGYPPSSAPPPLNATYHNPPPTMQYTGMAPQPTANMVALNSVPNTNRSWGGNYGPGWYNYSSANRKKAFIIVAVCGGVMVLIFVIVFVTLFVKSQQEHDAFRKKHFGD